MENSNKRKVLVIRFSSIGDIVLCTPVIRCLKQLPGVELHFLTKRSFAGFMSHNPYIDKVHLLDKSLPAVIKELKKERFDFVVDLHNNLRSLRVKLALGRPSRSFHKLNFQKWLLTTFRIDRMPPVHIVDRYMHAAAPLGVVNDGEGLDFFIPDNDKVALGDLPEVFQKGYIAFVIGGTYPTKRLPAEKIISLCSKLPLPVILLGGPEDAKAGEAIAKACGESVLNACGRFSLNSSASLVEQSKVVISHDTGLMHIAAAFNKPIASVWGNTVPELGMYPYLPQQRKTVSQIFEVKGLSCRPCSKIGYNACPKKHFRCMADMDESAVVKWVEQRVGAM